MLKSKKAKCTGCAALVSGEKGFSCGLNFKVKFKKTRKGITTAPVPQEACYRPKDKKELKQAEKLVNA